MVVILEFFTYIYLVISAIVSISMLVILNVYNIEYSFIFILLFFLSICNFLILFLTIKAINESKRMGMKSEQLFGLSLASLFFGSKLLAFLIIFTKSSDFYSYIDPTLNDDIFTYTRCKTCGCKVNRDEPYCPICGEKINNE